MENNKKHTSVVGLPGGEVAAQQPASPPEAQTRLSSASIVANLDTLKISLWIDFGDSNLLEKLEEAKQKAQIDEVDSEPIDIGKITWNCQRVGAKQYTFRLIRGDVRLLFNRRKHDGLIPNARLEIGSIPCWVPGYEETYNSIINSFQGIGLEIKEERVSEAHLAVDFIGIDINTLPIQKQENWISRAHNFASYYNRKKFTGCIVGKGDLLLRIYDKVLQLQNESHKQQYFKTVWGLEFFGEQPVTRVEFQMRRPILNDFDPPIATLENLKNCLASLWKYCSQNWCKLADKPVDRNHHQSRAEIHPWWSIVQQITWEDVTESYRVKRQLCKDIERNRAYGVGNYMTIAASFGCRPDDIDGIVKLSREALTSDLRRKYQEDSADFERKMKRKWNETTGPLSRPFGPLNDNE